MSDPEGALVEVLGRQRDRDLLGRVPVEEQISHALAFGRALCVPGRVLDLGSGGGVPGLVLVTLLWPEATATLVDASQRRCTYLEICVGELGLSGRVDVRHGRAEELGHAPDLRGRADLVVARSFGPPAATAECGAPFLRVGGTLAVSEPPGGSAGRWDAAGLAVLGLGPAVRAESEGIGLVTMAQTVPCPERFPRRVGRPSQRPLF